MAQRRNTLPSSVSDEERKSALEAAAALLREIAPNFKFRVLRDRVTNRVIDGQRTLEALPFQQIETVEIDTGEPQMVRVLVNLLGRPMSNDERAISAVLAFCDPPTDQARENRKMGRMLSQGGGDVRDLLRLLAGGIPRHFIDNAKGVRDSGHKDLIDEVLRGQTTARDARRIADARAVLPSAEPLMRLTSLTHQQRDAILKLPKRTAEKLVTATAKITDEDQIVQEVRERLSKSALGTNRAKAKIAGLRDVRLTPTEIVEAVRWAFDGHILFDPAAPWANPTGAFDYATLDEGATEEHRYDGCSRQWPDATFVNPPYSHRTKPTEPSGIDEFIEHAIRMRDADHRPRIYMLLPSRPDSAAGQRALAECDDALFLSDRLFFDTIDGEERIPETGTANMANVIVAFNTTTIILDMFLRERPDEPSGVVMAPRLRPNTRWRSEALAAYEELTDEDFEMLNDLRERDEAERDPVEVRAMLEDAAAAETQMVNDARGAVGGKRLAAESARKEARKNGRKKR